MPYDRLVPNVGEIGYLPPWMVRRYDGLLWLPRDTMMFRQAGGTVCVGAQRHEYSYSIWYEPTVAADDPFESIRDDRPKEGSLVCRWLDAAPTAKESLYKAEPTWYGVYVTSPKGHRFFVRDDT